MVVVALPQVAAAQESAAAGTVYDKKLYERLVSEGHAARRSALRQRSRRRDREARAAQQQRVLPRRGRRRPGDHAERQPAADRRGRRLLLGGGRGRLPRERHGDRLLEAFQLHGVGDLGRDEPRSAAQAPTRHSASEAARLLGVEEPEPLPEPERARAEPTSRRPTSRRPETPKATCMFRPVNARVRGRMIRKVVFTLDGRAVEIVRSPDSEGRFGVTVERRSLSRGRHMLRAKVVFVRSAKRDARAPAARLPALPGAGDPEGGPGRPGGEVRRTAVPRMGARSAHPARLLPARRQAARQRVGRRLARALRRAGEPERASARASTSCPPGSSSCGAQA